MVQVSLQADQVLEIRSPLWNMPTAAYDSRGPLLVHLLRQWIDSYGPVGDPLRFLEIGVWQAGTIRDVHGVAEWEYIGIDPYGQQVDDPYRGLFWETTEEMDAAFLEASRVFDELGGELIRATSDDYFASSDTQFDAVFVDGDHRYTGALNDLNHALDRLKPGGILIVDDVANSFHPQVEWAVREFYNTRKSEIARYGCHPLFFRLDGCPLPTVLEFGVFEKAGL